MQEDVRAVGEKPADGKRGRVVDEPENNFTHYTEYFYSV